MVNSANFLSQLTACKRYKVYILCLFGVALGCVDDKPYELAPVRGKVTLDGEVIEGAVVSFQPRSTGSFNVGPGSTGKCDKTGFFELTTIKREPGAVVGKHRVRIYSANHELKNSHDDSEVASKELVPEIYNYRSTLEFEVPLKGSDEANFSLFTATLPNSD